ncbi:hypothetical protein EVAR_61002_1 [Eumeta japonica]|uniref:Uncharacterized protein n=1 Tax=Eumeta variegata TaxID=151549 RepID=A0A4C1ZEX3_EUMVA|nr:hypothetical protein EVAR_61002_1 [Eumeta japonica]
MSVWGTAQCTSRGDSQATFVCPVIYSGDRTVCTPSPRTVSASRERSRRRFLVRASRAHFVRSDAWTAHRVIPSFPFARRKTLYTTHVISRKPPPEQCRPNAASSRRLP